MRVLRAKDYRRMPWKNGGGETLEIAVEPPQAALDTFDWRISMARVERDGPFSQFPGVDRTLTVVSGQGCEIHVDQSPPSELTPISDPFAFSGDAATHATLIRGAVTDLNVMTRRATHRHVVQRLRFVGSRELKATAALTALFVVDGRLQVVSVDDGANLHAFDVLLLNRKDWPGDLRGSGPVEIVRIDIDRGD